MQLYPLIAVAVVLLADDMPGADVDAMTDAGAWAIVATSVLSVAGVLVAAGLFARWAHRRALARQSVAWHLTAHRIVRQCRPILLLLHAASVWGLGLLDALHHLVGDPILLDELLALAPPTLGAAVTFWMLHPLEMFDRQAATVRRLDGGLAPLDLPGRTRFTIVETRAFLLPLLGPMLLILACGEIARHLADTVASPTLADRLRDGGSLVGGVLVVVVAPAFARWALPVHPLAPGPTRDAMFAICRRHRVRVRDVLVWKTGSRIVNAAIMGFIPRFRYVLLTDALLETVPDDGLAAVMAHEVAHARRQHMPWLLVGGAASIVIGTTAVWGGASLATVGGLALDSDWGHLVQGLASLVIAVVCFGWISRRFEWQADAFAAQHLTAVEADGLEAVERPLRITARASGAIVATLEGIERLHGGPSAHRRQRGRRLGEVVAHWRHGSIAIRRQRLLALVGRPVDGLTIDRQVRWIKLAALTILLIGGGLAALDPFGPGEPSIAYEAIDRPSPEMRR